MKIQKLLGNTKFYVSVLNVGLEILLKEKKHFIVQNIKMHVNLVYGKKVNILIRNWKLVKQVQKN